MVDEPASDSESLGSQLEGLEDLKKALGSRYVSATCIYSCTWAFLCREHHSAVPPLTDQAAASHCCVNRIAVSGMFYCMSILPLPASNTLDNFFGKRGGSAERVLR
jgi:hypothetical protein